MSIKAFQGPKLCRKHLQLCCQHHPLGLPQLLPPLGLQGLPKSIQRWCLHSFSWYMSVLYLGTCVPDNMTIALLLKASSSSQYLSPEMFCGLYVMTVTGMCNAGHVSASHATTQSQTNECGLTILPMCGILKRTSCVSCH